MPYTNDSISFSLMRWRWQILHVNDIHNRLFQVEQRRRFIDWIRAMHIHQFGGRFIQQCLRNAHSFVVQNNILVHLEIDALEIGHAKMVDIQILDVIVRRCRIVQIHAVAHVDQIVIVYDRRTHHRCIFIAITCQWCHLRCIHFACIRCHFSIRLIMMCLRRHYLCHRCRCRRWRW